MGWMGLMESDFQLGAWRVRPQLNILVRDQRTIHLEPKMMGVLVCLAQRSGEVVPKEQLVREVWRGTFVTDDVLIRCVSELRKAFGDSAGRPTIIETIPKRGYRLLLPVVPVARPNRDEGETLATRAVAVPPRRRFRWNVIIPAAAVAILTAATLIAVVARHFGSARGRINSIAIMPFANVSGDPNVEYLSDGITESLIDNLARVPQVKVKSRNSVFRYKGKDLDTQRVGHDLGVSALVIGRLEQRGGNVEVSAELSDIRDSTVVWGQHYSGKSADIISLQRQIADDIAAKLRSQLSPSEREHVTKQGTQNPEAYELYLKGRYSWNKRTSADIAASISYFNQAIAKDPGYALAYSGLADAYGVLPGYRGNPSENYSKSNAAARKALQLDPTLARPHANLGGNAMDYDWDFAGGEVEYKKAFELDPDDATAHQWYAGELSLIGGRETEALAEINLAHQLDPVSPIISWDIGDVHIRARRYDEAIGVCRKLANENPTFMMAHRCLAQAYWGKRMYPQVIEEGKAVGQLSGDRNDSEFASAMEQGFRSAGWKGALTRGIHARQAQRKTGYSSAYAIATMYADLGDADQAFRWLNTAYQERDYYLLGLETEFALDTIRSDPRFSELVRKVGLH